MATLHVERPTTLTRVSEYLPEIVTFVEGIVNRGLAYEAGGSVWFDTTKFEGAKGEESKDGDDGWKHTYAKLQPWSKGNRELLEDGEGESLKLLRSFDYLLTLFAYRFPHLHHRQALSIRLCSVEGLQAWRARVAVDLGSRSARMAHRVQCDGQRSSRGGHGRSLGRSRPRLPSPR